MIKMMQSVGQSKFHVLRFEQPSFSFTTFIYRQHSFYFKPYFGEDLKKATFPTRTTNEELSTDSFMTKMKQSISQSKVSCSKIMVLRVSLLQLVIIIMISILNPILGRSSRKPPDPPSPRVRPIRNWMSKVSWLKWSNEALSSFEFQDSCFIEFWFLTSLTYHHQWRSQ